MYLLYKSLKLLKYSKWCQIDFNMEIVISQYPLIHHTTTAAVEVHNQDEFNLISKDNKDILTDSMECDMSLHITPASPHIQV